MSIMEFNTDDITHIAAATRGHQQQWDDIWNGVRSKLSATVASALDSTTGGSLDQRTQEYHRKTTQYTEQLNGQHTAVTRVGNIATDTNDQMAKTIRG